MSPERTERRFSIIGKTVSFLYKLARTANDIEKLSSGDPKKIARRAKNKYIGRKLVKRAWKFQF
ncbi:MAG: hypothetical protein A3C38_03390 [Planctomycetes bacterium RIFCSPHIGHO2_02_FULL_50_42]|nr:MAG: hypothetical protein A2060_06665 [Planctomycetes bacterium GWA2_50_13]OHB88794.1 MAG: hypothetical protein A3C38_03390 [Planctomycetes bacterium RIFCSPHIGHO2_02_FULL_50_42]OHB95674.1 MAG: hypothetical protein A3I59_09610 [Planctomycetes bacterium RIFCSPLOWO2_02_FULL_50_16]HCN20598.1 hypothetical protein [Planctomycetia bacterium]